LTLGLPRTQGYALPIVSSGLYVLVAAIWIVPDTRIERAMRP
jgi:hypothetical protein